MRTTLRKVSLSVTSAAALTWIGIHGVKGQQPTHGWYDIALYIIFGVGVVIVLLTWPPITGRLPWGQPKLELRGVGQYFRSARQSREDNDLQVIYARVRNVRNGGGERATLNQAKAWMSVVDEDGRPVGHGCEGNWVDVSAGTPDPTTFKEATFRPNGAQYGLEIAAKFVWSADAYLAGEVHPNLPPGKYRIQASISDAVHKATVFEWEVVNPGATEELTTKGLTPPPADLTQSVRRLSEIATAAAASASQSDVSVSWGGTALPPEGGFSGVSQQVEAEGIQIAGAKQFGEGRPKGFLTTADYLASLRNKGVDLLNRDRPDVGRALLDRAAEEWIDEVREATESEHPAVAAHFTIPTIAGPRYEGQSRRLRELVQRLNFLVQDLNPSGLVITSAKYGVPPNEVDVRGRLVELIDDDGVLDFEVGPETLLVDPAPDRPKKLSVRWQDNGEPDASMFLDGTHVVIPRSAARKQ